MPKSLLTAEEVSETITGFEEIAVEKHMGVDVYMDAETKPIKVIRALVFVVETRDGLKPADAFRLAQEMPLSEVMDYFTEADESDEDDGDTPAGKEDSPGSAPSAPRRGVSQPAKRRTRTNS